MSTEQNKAVVRRFVEEVINKHNLAKIDELFNTDYVNHTPGLPPGREAEKQLNSVSFAAFPDARVTIEDLVAEGDKVAARVSYRGTPTGDFMGIPPTGKQFIVTGAGVFRVADGKIAEQWSNLDMLSLMQQLGAIPRMGDRQSVS